MMVSMLLGLAWLAVPFGALASLFLWARWLRKRTAAPERVSTVAFVAILVDLGLIVLLPLAGSVYATIHFSALGAGVDPSQKSRVLAEAISEAMYCTALLWVVAVLLTVLYVLYATWRWHWSARASDVPREPPYR